MQLHPDLANLYEDEKSLGDFKWQQMFAPLLNFLFWT